MTIFCAALMLIAGQRGTAQARIPTDKIDVGVLAPAYHPSGLRQQTAAVVAASMAAEKYGKDHVGPLDVSIHAAESGSRPGDDLNQVRKWLKEKHVSLVVDAAGSADAPAIARLLQAQDRVLITAALSRDPGQELCAPTVAKWGGTPALLARAIARLHRAEDQQRFFVLASQDGFGAALMGDLAPALQTTGGKLAGQEFVPVGERDFTASFGRASRSGAQFMVLAMQGSQLQDAMVQARQQGLQQRMQFVLPGATIDVIDELGLDTAASALVVTGWYWNQDDDSRKFADDFAERLGRRRPDATDATVYTAVLSYIEAAWKRQSVDADKVMAEWRKAPPQHSPLGAVSILPDGRAAHDLQIYRVKRPGQAGRPWDDYMPLQTISAMQAYAGPCGAISGSGKEEK